jgi:16S rRNA (cytidine1402-2'-O)-methyltransferase
MHDTQPLRAIFPFPVTQPKQDGRLLVVGTPIGNLEDLAPRGRRALAEADVLFCEDTRVTAKLASRFGLTARRVACPGPREESRVAELLERLGRGETVALVTDAGMPGLSDPGARLVAAASDAGFPVSVVPGPSAPAAALAVSGLPAAPHFFAGFLPAREGERRRALEAMRGRAETLVWFEAPHRLRESLAAASDVLGPRRACVARELTKLHEEVARGTLPELAARFAEGSSPKGEITVVVEGAAAGAQAEAATDAEVDHRIREALAAGASLKALSKTIGRSAGRPARAVYARALELARR